MIEFVIATLRFGDKITKRKLGNRNRIMIFPVDNRIKAGKSFVNRSSISYINRARSKAAKIKRVAKILSKIKG